MSGIGQHRLRERPDASRGFFLKTLLVRKGKRASAYMNSSRGLCADRGSPALSLKLLLSLEQTPVEPCNSSGVLRKASRCHRGPWKYVKGSQMSSILFGDTMVPIIE